MVIDAAPSTDYLHNRLRIVSNPTGIVLLGAHKYHILRICFNICLWFWNCIWNRKASGLNKVQACDFLYRIDIIHSVKTAEYDVSGLPLPLCETGNGPGATHPVASARTSSCYLRCLQYLRYCILSHHGQMAHREPTGMGHPSPPVLRCQSQPTSPVRRIQGPGLTTDVPWQTTQPRFHARAILTGSHWRDSRRHSLAVRTATLSSRQGLHRPSWWLFWDTGITGPILDTGSDWALPSHAAHGQSKYGGRCNSLDQPKRLQKVGFAQMIGMCCCRALASPGRFLFLSLFASTSFLHIFTKRMQIFKILRILPLYTQYVVSQTATPNRRSKARDVL